jgi:16S rRNA (guanine966-N2)-methyltransferase
LDTEILNVDARRYLGGSCVEAFDIVFLDPPFAAELHDELCRLMSAQNWLAADARIYIEMDKAQAELRVPDDWTILNDKTAGNVRYLLAAPSV